MYYYVILQDGTTQYSGNDREAARDICQAAREQGLNSKFIMINGHGRKYVHDYWDPNTDVDYWCPLIPAGGTSMRRAGNEVAL